MQQRSQFAAAVLVALSVGSLATACVGESADDERSQSALETSVDTFDDGDVSNWHDIVGSGSAVTHRISTSRAQSGTESMKITYTLASGSYGGEETLFATRPNWSAYVGLRVWVYGLGTGHRFEVQLYDGGGERWQSSFVVSFSGWQLITLPFSGFQRTSWQPSSATVNNVRDLVGVRGLSLLPAVGGAAASGSVYLDSLSVVDAAGVSGTSLITPAPAPATTPTAASPAAGPATKVLIPLYAFPTAQQWNDVIAAKNAHPTVPVYAVVNPSNGPGTRVSASFTAGIARLLAAGIKVIGYVDTAYGARAAATVQAEIAAWKTYYPGTTGIFFDEQSAKVGYEAYYKNLTAYAKSKGFDFTVGNPGADSAPSYVGTVDMLLIYESDGLPSLERLAGWHASYDRKNFGIIPYNCPGADPTYVAAARQRVSFMYLQSDTMPNPWDTTSIHLNSLLSQLED